MLMQLGLTRGLLYQAVGTVAGMALAMIWRLLAGMDFWDKEVVFVVGGLTGGFAFMWGVGAIDDWLQWCRGAQTPLHHGPPAGKPAWTRYFSTDYNHKVIGIQYSVI